jgi:hypothetical protein
MGLTLLSHCSFQIGLDSSDFPFFVSGARNPRRHEVHAAGQHFKTNYKLPYIVLVSEPEHQAKPSGRSRTNLMEFVKPTKSCPIECNRLLVCVRISCGHVSACSIEQIVRSLRRADCPHALQQAFPLASSFSPTSSCKRNRSCLALRRRPPPAAAATARGLFCAAAAVVLVACSGSLCCIGLGRHFWHTINQNILVRFQQTRPSLAQWSR